MSIGRFTIDNLDYRYKSVRTENTIDNFYNYIDSLGLRFKESFVYQNATVKPGKYYTFTYERGKVFGLATGEYDKNGMKVTLYTNSSH